MGREIKKEATLAVNRSSLGTLAVFSVWRFYIPHTSGVWSPLKDLKAFCLLYLISLMLG